MKTRLTLTATVFILSQFLLPESALAQNSPAQTPTDTVKATALDEVVVEGVTREAITDGVSYVPSRNVRRHSMNIGDMLARMMVAGLKSDPFATKPETISGKEVAVFIDGAEAEEWEVKAIRPGDVARVNYLQSPSDPRYRGKQYVLDIMLRKSDYGGYAVIDAGQGIILDEGQYTLTGKVTRKRWTFQAYADAHYRNAGDIETSTDTRYSFSDGTVVERKALAENSESTRDASGAFMARYSTEDFYMSLSTGYRHDRTPENNSRQKLTYSGGAEEDTEESEAFSEASSRQSAAYLKSVFEFYNLPHKASVYAKAGVSYNHSNSSSTYTAGVLSDPLPNGARSDAWFPYARLDYSLPVFGGGRLTAAANWYSEIYRTQYSGTYGSFQKLTNSYLYLILTYRHSLNRDWNISGYVQSPISFQKVNDARTRSSASFDGNVRVNGQIGREHSLSAYAALSRGVLPPRYYNDVLRQDNEMEGTKGNAELKPERYGEAGVSHSWMPGNVFSLSSSFYWELIHDEVVPYWHEEGRLMVNDWVNGGDYNKLSLTVTPSVSLLGGNLNIQGLFNIEREMHSGHRKFAFYAFRIYPYVSYNLNSHFSVSATYSTPWSKGYMKGGKSVIGKFSDKLNLSLTYHTGNLFLSCDVQSVLRPHGYFKSYYESPHYTNYGRLSRPSDGRYVWFSLRYTLDFGKKIRKGGDIRFDGKVKSGVL